MLSKIIGLFFTGVLAFFFISLVIFIISYIFRGIGLSEIARREGNDKDWLAWVPIGNAFLLTMLVEDDVHESLRGRYTLVYGIMLISSILIGTSFSFFFILPIAMTKYAFYFIATRYSENNVAHLIIAVITFGFSVPFQFFRFRNREPLFE